MSFFEPGIIGIIPRSEVNTETGEDGLPGPAACVTQVNKMVAFKVKEIKETDDGQTIATLSRKEAQLDAKQWMAENLVEGMVIRGIVRNMEKYGLFVDIGCGIIGLLHTHN
ncbi:MAG: S1 RNA-binding domain-containing protein [Bacillota bacterium]|nr:S1 RNA-binding domain-containing protein [Bacillota bacterium]